MFSRMLAARRDPSGFDALFDDTSGGLCHSATSVSNRDLARRRTGTIYIMAMGTSLIVVCLAVAGLQAVRVQRRMNDAQSQIANAKKLAQAGIEFVQQSMFSDPIWRTRFTHGVPVTRATGGGSFSVTLIDPDDGVISNQSTDPIVITSTGRIGTAIQKRKAYLEPQTKLYAACRSSLCATTEIVFDNCTITSNHWAFCEQVFSVNGNPTVKMNCLSANGSSVGIVSGQRFVRGGVWPMNKPNMVTKSSGYVGRYYTDNSVGLLAKDLPTGGTQLVMNGGFEQDSANWTMLGGSLTRDTTQKIMGLASCLVSGRIAVLSIPSQNVTKHMLKRRSYTLSFWVRAAEAQDFYAAISCNGSGSVLPSISKGSNVPVDAGVWTLVSNTVSPDWSGVLTNAEFQIGSSKSSNYHFDDASLLNNDRVPGTRYIENILLSDTVNPFGSGAVSANGLYSISVPGENLLIRDCRINGTIVVSDSIITELRNAVSWEPIGRYFPAVISSEAINDLTTNVSLIESDIGVNFNPPTSPYNGSSDSTTNDTYPSTIQGAIVSNRDILLNGVSTLTGPVMSDQKITVRSNDLSINFPSNMIVNPPPGFFADPPPMRLIPSSVQSVP